MKRELNINDITELEMIPTCLLCKNCRRSYDNISCNIIPQYAKKWVFFDRNLFNETCKLFKIDSKNIEQLAWYTVNKTGRTVTYTKGQYTYVYGQN